MLSVGQKAARMLVDDYRPGAAHDELRDPNGTLRPHWAPLVEGLAALGPAELGRRWAQAQDLIHENGVSYNIHGDPRGMDRPWPLSPVPVVLPATAWQAVAAALAQRARLLELLLDDVYGPQRLVREGLLPPALVHAHPGYLRACQGLAPPDGSWLPLYAADLLRGADGRFLVLSDRAQVPTGAGYALENRIIVSRVLQEAFRGCNVERLAPFFRAVRDSLAGRAPRNKDNPRVVMLSPGPSDTTYFEQAFLAQYLGYPLVHGGDLTVRGGRVYLKTLGGLHPVDVILRRMNDHLCDPLELRPDGLSGVPGLVQAVREKAVAIANPLGSGFAAAPALLPYLPTICRALLGEELRIDSVETHWCGDPAARARVMEELPAMVVKPAFDVASARPIFPAELSTEERGTLRARIEAEPLSFVAQRRMTIGTTPALVTAPGAPAAEQALAPRPFVLRTYLVANGDSHLAMPGGLSRFAPDAGAPDVSMQRGGRSKDTWVVSGVAVSRLSLLPPATAPVTLSRGGSDLPSRVADNLFWLGRYAERAEGLARLARVIASRLGELGGEGQRGTDVAPLARALRALVTTEEEAADPAAPEEILVSAIDDERMPGSLRSTLRALQRVARECRDRLSGDSWRVLMGLDAELGRAASANGDRVAALQPLLDDLVMRLSALGGIIGDSMTRGQAWRFLDIGRRLERAAALTVLVRRTVGAPSDREGPLFEAVLEAADSGMTYRRRYLNRLAAAPVLDLLLTDETNPRAVLFQVLGLGAHVAALPRDGQSAVRTREQRIALELRHALELADVHLLAEVVTSEEGSGRPALTAFLDRLSAALPALSEALSASYLSHATVSRQLGGGGRLYESGT